MPRVSPCRPAGRAADPRRRNRPCTPCTIPTEGGVITALHEIGRGGAASVWRVHRGGHSGAASRAAAICAALGLDPLGLLASGALLATLSIPPPMPPARSGAAPDAAGTTRGVESARMRPDVGRRPQAGRGRRYRQPLAMPELQARRAHPLPRVHRSNEPGGATIAGDARPLRSHTRSGRSGRSRSCEQRRRRSAQRHPNDCPTEAMRRAMASAEVGDDVFGEDLTVNVPEEERCAEILFAKPKRLAVREQRHAGERSARCSRTAGHARMT